MIDGLEKFCSKTLRDKGHNPKIIYPLYHYTSWEALSKILKTETLWFTYHKHLNDPTEFVFARNVIKSEMIKIRESLTFNYDFQFWNMFWEKFEKDCSNFNFYLFSLSSEGDSL